MIRPRQLAALRPRLPWGWAAAGAAFGLAASVVLAAPAQWVGAVMASTTGQRVTLLDARGTVWTGSATLLLTGGQDSRDAAALPSRIEWQLRPVASGFELKLASSCCTPQPVVLRIQPRWAGAALAVADGPPSHWPAQLLSGLGTPWNTLQIEGDLQLATQGLSMEWIQHRLRVTGQAELTAHRVSSRLSTLRPMGSYRITLAGGATPTLDVSTIEGSLLLAGQGQWLDSRLRFAGEASAAPDREAALANLLSLIGRRSGARSIITLG